MLTAADIAFGIIGNTLPEPYRSEMKGVADVLEMPFGEIVLYNIFYELFTVSLPPINSGQPFEIFCISHPDVLHAMYTILTSTGVYINCSRGSLWKALPRP